jgi:sugar (pentulose or hexulose) kinase
MTHPGAIFTPIPANVQIYEQMYRQVYRKLYGKLGPLYKSIRSITGYPA